MTANRLLTSILFLVSAVAAQTRPDKFAWNALVPGSFASFEEENFGNSSLLRFGSFSPFAVAERTTVIKDEILVQLNKDVPWYKDLIPGFNSTREEFADMAIKLHGRFRIEDYTAGLWGICVSNSANDPSLLSENMLVGADPVRGRIYFADFGKIQTVQISAAMRSAASFFDVEIPRIKPPLIGEPVMPIRNAYGDKSTFKEPRGIVTDRAGNFWVADMGNNRIVRLFYDNTAGRMEYKGEIKGLASPVDVALMSQPGMARALVVVNAGNNSIVMIEADVEGEVSYGQIPGERKQEVRAIWHEGGMLRIVAPQAVGGNAIYQEEFYVTHANNEILKFRRTGGFAFDFSGTKYTWPTSGLLTSIKSDKEGQLFVLDNSFGYVGKLSHDLVPLFFTGGHNSGDKRDSKEIGFNHPRYLALGNDSKSVYVSEAFERWSGLQRLYDWPRFLGGKASFTMDCGSGPVEDKSIHFDYDLTKKGMVAVSIFRVPDPAEPERDHQWLHTYNFTDGSGHAHHSFRIGDLPWTFEEGGTYVVKFGVNDEQYAGQDSDHPLEVSDELVYWTDFSAASFVVNSTAIGSPYFNPATGSGAVEFNLNREANITFKIRLPDNSFVTVADKANYNRLPRGSSTAAINIKPADRSKLQEMRGYPLWAEIEAVPNCGAVNLIAFPASPSNSFYLDMTAPTGVFSAFATTKFNPRHSSFTFGFQASDFRPTDFPAGELSTNRIRSALRVYRKSDLQVPIRYSVFDEVDQSGTVKQAFWDGRLDDGTLAPSNEYVLSLFMTDRAGNTARVNSPSFILDIDAPEISLSLGSQGHAFADFMGKRALLLFRDQTATVNYAYSDRFPKELVPRYDKLNPQDATVVSTYSHPPIPRTTSGPGTYTLRASDFSSDGIFGLSVYGVDQVGNSSADNPARTLSHPSGAIPYVWVNQKPPLLSAKLGRNVIRSREKTELIVSAYNQGSFPGYSFTYRVDLSYGGASQPAFAQGILDPKTPTAVIPFDHGLSPYTSVTGKFAFKVTLTVNLGGIGNSQEQVANLFVDTFPPFFDGVSGQEVPQKFLLSGQAGDPNPANDQNRHGFESYSIYYQPGQITALPSALTGWRSIHVNVPYHTVDRNGPHASAFPHSHVADNQEAVASALGNNVLAYVDGSAAGGNFAPGGYYTFLVIAKEKGIDPGITASNASLKTVRIASPAVPRLEALSLNDAATGDVSFAAGANVLRIGARVVGGAAGTTVDARVYVFSESADMDGDGVKEPIVARLERKAVPVNTAFDLAWDGKDGKGSFVKNGDYTVAMLIEQQGTGLAPSFDAVFSTGRKLSVTTPLVLLDGTFGPTRIAATPDGIGIPANTATFKYKVSKASQTWLEIQDTDGNRLFDVGPETNQDGAGVFHLLGWNATDPRTGRPVAGAMYRIRPYATVPQDPSTRAYYVIPGSIVNYYSVEVTGPAGETPGLGSFVHPGVVFGNSDAIWKSRPLGRRWHADPVPLTNAIRDQLQVKLTGLQTGARYLPANFSGTYARRHTRLGYRLKAKVQVDRKKWCNAYVHDENDYVNAENGSPVVGYYEWNETNVPIPANRFSHSPVIPFNEPYAWRFPGSEALISDDWTADHDCGLWGSWEKVIANPHLRWIKVYALDGTPLDVITPDADAAVDPPTDPETETGAFNFQRWVHNREDDFNFYAEYQVLQHPNFSNLGDFGTTPVYPTQVVPPVTIPGITYGIEHKLIQLDGYQVQVNMNIPPGGRVEFTLPYPVTLTSQTPSYTFQFAPIPDNERLQMPIRYSYHMDAMTGHPEAPVANVPFPFPPSSCGVLFQTEAGNMVNIWDPAQHWAIDPATGMPKGRHANQGCDFVPALTLPAALSPGQSVAIDISSLVPAGVTQPNFTFLAGGTTVEVLAGNARLVGTVQGNTLTLTYPVDEARMSKVAWNPAGTVGDDDPILLAGDNAFRGYMRLGPPAEVFNPRNFPVSDALPHPVFSPSGEEQNLLANYGTFAASRGLGIPPYARTRDPEWEKNTADWKYGAWLDASGNPTFHWDRGLTHDGWDPIAFEYIDESPNTDWEYDDNRASGEFTPKVRGLPTPKRFVPIRFQVNTAIPGLAATSLMALEAGNPKAVWEPIALRPSAASMNAGDNLLGIWPVTNKAGTYHVRLLATDGTTNYQVTTTMRIGTEVDAGRNSTKTVQSPLKKVELDFPPGSRFAGMVALDPTDPATLPGFNFGNTPKGPVVDVTPSGLVFDEADAADRPQLRFALTQADVTAAGGDISRLGQIGVYYLNDKTNTLENAQFSAWYYDVADQVRHPVTGSETLGPDQVLELKGTLQHTSLYGAFSLDAFVTFDPVATPTTANTVDLGGATNASGQVYLYASTLDKWDPAALLVGTAPISGGRWSKQAVPLASEGENYLFASIGPASAGHNEPTNSIRIRKDTMRPVITGFAMSPKVAGAGTKVVQVEVTLSEPGSVRLFLPPIAGQDFVEPTRGEGNTAVFSVAIVNLEGLPLMEGQYPLFVNAMDLVGNSASAMRQEALTVDRTAPRLQVDPIAFTGRITGRLDDNLGLGWVDVLRQDGVLVKRVPVSGTSSPWLAVLTTADIPWSEGEISVIGYDLGGNASQQVAIAAAKLFPGLPAENVAVFMRETALGAQDISKPEIYLTNNLPSPVSGFTLRLWLSREEAAHAEVAVDRLKTNPCGITYQVRYLADNPNVVALDIRYPENFALAPGQSTAADGLALALHYRNPSVEAWAKGNDWSWAGVTGNFAFARNVAVYDREGNKIGGIELDPADVPSPPAAPPTVKERVAAGLQALYFFHEGTGAEASDLSDTGIPLDLHFQGAGAGAAWVERGGIDFKVQDHDAILENRTPNRKLLDASIESDQLALETWIVPGNTSQSSARLLSYAHGGGSLDRNWDMLQNGRNLEFRLRTSNSPSVSLSTTGNPLGQAGLRYHVAMTYKPFSAANGSGGMRIYVNGVLAASNQESGALDAAGANAWDAGYVFSIGNRPGVRDRDWQGTLLMGAVYSAALTQEEILKNKEADLREPIPPAALRAGVECHDRLIPSDIVDGVSPWLEDASASGSTLAMGGVAYRKGLGGKPGSGGSTAFLIYDMDSEAARLGVNGKARRITGFTGYQDGAAAAGISIKVGHSARKPSDQDWFDNSGAVSTVFTLNNGNNLPMNFDLGGARWLWIGQNSLAGNPAAAGVFGNLRVHFGASGATPPEFLSGLEYRYYEGQWSTLPEFGVMNPVQKGIVKDINLAPRLRNDHFAFEFIGAIQVPAGGTYTFFTASDDGSRLFIDGDRIVDNDGIHPETERSGSVYLTAGMHALRVLYFDALGGEILKVSYQGPGIPKTRIPENVLFRPGSAPTTVPQRTQYGLQALYNFRRESGDVAFDLSGSALPLDLDRLGANAAWIEGGGISFQGDNHGAILENRAPNRKLSNAIVQTGEVSLEAWIEPASLGAGQSRPVLLLGASDGGVARNFALVQNGNDLVFALRTASNASQELATTGQVLASGAGRYHVVMTYKPNGNGANGGMRIYVNGILKATNSESGLISGTGAHPWSADHILSVGNRPTSLDADWPGKIFLTAVFNRVLTPDQVKSHFQAGASPRIGVDRIALGVYSEERLLPGQIRDGAHDWEEDLDLPGGGPLLMGGISHRLGISGSPRANGSPSSLLYDLVSEKEALGIIGAPVRLTGYVGRQDGTGDVRLSIKTSNSATAPSVTEWFENAAGVKEAFTAENQSNAPIDIDLSQSRWIWLDAAGPVPANPGRGLFAGLNVEFGDKNALNMQPGLHYAYFEATVDNLPDLDAMAPAKSGIVEQFVTSPASRSENFLLEFKGFLQIHAPGSYTFFTNSDDGSRLFIDGKRVVDNDGIHPAQEASGTVTLTAGFHPIKVQFFQKGGGMGLDVRYQGPGISKQSIPSNLLFHSGTYGYGLDAAYYEGTWNVLPDFGAMSPVSSDVRSKVRITPRPRNDAFGFAFDGSIYLPTAGDYVLSLNSDDGSKLFLDGKLAVDNDGIHAMQERSATLSLAAGFHSLRVVYFERDGGEGLEAKIQGPGMSQMPIPSEMLFRGLSVGGGGGNPNPVPCSGAPCGRESAITLQGQVADVNYSISGTQWFKVPVSSYPFDWPRKVVVALDHMDNRVMEGYFQFENGSPQTLNTWFQSFSVPYTRQGDVYFTITVPSDRYYKVRWWYD
jgi:hypothetical protein